jgi:hypothetical protein
MLKSAARPLAKDILALQGKEKKRKEKRWHPVIIRFGANTCKSDAQPSA